MEWATDAFGLRRTDRVGNHAPLHFDLSLFDYVSTAMATATTVIVSEARQKLPASMSQLIENERVSVWFSVPLAWTHMVSRGVLEARDLRGLRVVIFGGEPCPRSVLEAAMTHAANATFFHVYGVTESNVCTCYRVPRPLPRDEIGDRSLPIGSLCPHFDAAVLDGDQPVRQGHRGELAVHGPAVMLGYWNRPDANKTAFWTPPTASGHTGRYYRTGDLVTCDSDGIFHFLGRADRQVKSRGHRVELDDIQSALAAVSGVAEAAVVATADDEGSHRLEAVLSLQPGCPWDEPRVRGALRERLAAYAVPATFRVVPTLPRTSAGKIDFRALGNRSAGAHESGES